VILCVDDEAILLMSLRIELQRKFGDVYRYEVATDPIAAKEKIEELVGSGVSIILIISDWLMPKMKGDEFLIGVHEKFPEISLIMITGQADARTIEGLRERIKPIRILEKPWKSDDLLAAVDQAIKSAAHA
jgi:DNA-binding NtrC family response regulator